MKKHFLIVFLAVPGLSACSMLDFDRSDASGYQSGEADARESVSDFYRERRRNNWNNAREELGMQDGHELTENETNAIQTRAELDRLEKNLTNDSERKQYYSYKPYFASDSERVAFLKLPNREAREHYVRVKGIATDESKFDQSTTSLIEKNDVSKGMSRPAVRQSWGEPDFVEVAGNPMYGNERWRYNKLVSTDDGYKQETRIIYFESGRVVGWETL